MTDKASDYITDPKDRAAFVRHWAKLELLGVVMDTTAARRDAAGARAALTDALVSIRALRNIVGIEQTRRRVAAERGW